MMMMFPLLQGLGRPQYVYIYIHIIYLPGKPSGREVLVQTKIPIAFHLPNSECRTRTAIVALERFFLGLFAPKPNSRLKKMTKTEPYNTENCQSFEDPKLVDGFNPFETYARQIGSSPQGSG